LGKNILLLNPPSKFEGLGNIFVSQLWIGKQMLYKYLRIYLRGGYTPQLKQVHFPERDQDTGVYKSLVPSTQDIIENPVAGKAGWKNDLSIAPIFVTESTMLIWWIP
jgi:hypothetical protein